MFQKNGSSASEAAFDHRVIPEKKLVTVKFGKTLTADEIATYAISLRANPTFDPAFSEIVDLTNVEKIDLHGQQMVKLADETDPFSFDSKRAFIVRNPAQTHAARMHRILRCSNDKIRTFNSFAEAEQWILS